MWNSELITVKSLPFINLLTADEWVRETYAVLIVAARNIPRVYFNEIHNKVTFFCFYAFYL